MPTRYGSAGPGRSRQAPRGDHDEPHSVLGAHAARRATQPTASIVRAFHPDAVELRAGPRASDSRPMEPIGGGIFEAFVAANARRAWPIACGSAFPGGASWERDDPYRFLPTFWARSICTSSTRGRIGGSGTCSGASRPQDRRGLRACRSRSGRPTRAARLGRRRFLRAGTAGCSRCGGLRQSGVFELFVPGLEAGAVYKFEIKTREGMLRLKTDPMARLMEVPPRSASRVDESSLRAGGDSAWMKARRAADLRAGPARRLRGPPGLAGRRGSSRTAARRTTATSRRASWST